MLWLRSAMSVVHKDLHSEFRTRYALNSLVMFVVTTLAITLFAFASEPVSREVLSGIFWIVVFFGSMSGLSRTFVSEEERGTALTLQLTAPAGAVFAGKLIFNILLSLFLTLLVTVLFSFFVDQFIVRSWGIFIVLLLLGSIGLASASTLVAAIIAKTNSRGTLFSVLSFPVLLPLFLAVISGTKIALEGAEFGAAAGEMQMLVSYCGAFIAGSTFLFEYIWNE